MMNYFTGDPHWTTSETDEGCRACQATIPAGSRHLVYPRTGARFCEPCGEEAWQEFREAAQAEYTETGPLPDDPAQDSEDWYPED